MRYRILKFSALLRHAPRKLFEIAPCFAVAEDQADFPLLTVAGKHLQHQLIPVVMQGYHRHAGAAVNGGNGFDPRLALYYFKEEASRY